jgi:GTPase SAR1 family protein
VYSVEDLQSFKEISFWINSLKQHGKNDISIILVANKCDLIERRIVPTQ